MFGSLLHFLAWQLLFTTTAVRGLHLYLKSGETKCFYENLAKRHLLIGDIDGYIEKDGIYVDDPDLKIGISLFETFDDDHRVLNQQNSHSGDFIFTALETGEHKICIQPMYPVRNAKIRIFIELDIGSVQALDSGMKDDTRSLQSRVSQLIQRLESIRSEQKVVRLEEAKFRDESEAVNSKILFWSVLQIAGLILVCFFQLRYLKNFFVKQKVV